MTVVAGTGVKAIIRSHVEGAGVGIMGEDITGVDERLLFAVVEGPQKGGDVVFEVLRIASVDENGIGEPTFVEVPGTLNGNCVVGGIG